jgi:hypothetical protein
MPNNELILLAALRPFEALVDQYEESCGTAGRIIPWVEFISEWSWPSEQDCINARIAIAKAISVTRA